MDEQRMTTTDLTERVQQALHRGQSARPRAEGFPFFAQALREAEITRTQTSPATGGSVYHLRGGAVVQAFAGMATRLGSVPAWDEAGLIAAIRADQAGHVGFPQFLRLAWESGVIDFTVDLVERTCTYRGVDDNHFTETYPAVTLPV